MNDAVLASYLDACLRQRPELRLGLPYLPLADRDALIALACLEQQFLDAIYGITDTAVAASKLHWWAGEFEQAAAGHARHPLTHALFANARAQAVVPEAWIAPIGAGLILREAAPASDFATQLAYFEPFHAALAKLENSYWFAAESDFARAARTATLGHMLAALGRIAEPTTALPVPMDLLARHAISREHLAMPSPQRQALLNDQIGNLEQAFRDAATLGGPLSLFRALTERMDKQQVQRAQRAPDAIQELQPDRRRPQLGMAWFAWRTARAWRHSPATDSSHEQS